MKILFIDDDLEDLELIGEAIDSIGIDISCSMTTNPLEGLNIIRKLRPDFVFIDINMPVLDGKSILERIRSDASLKKVKVCILSTSISLEDRQSYRRIGADHCMEKPNTFAELQARLRGFLISDS